MTRAQWWGSVLIVAGTAVGGGMLALPMVAAAAGFAWASIVLVVLWLLTLYTGLLVLEVSLAFPARRNGFASMSRATLGRPGEFLTWLLILLLLYALTSAYMTGASSLIDALFPWEFSQATDSVLFTVIFGGIVFWGTRATDFTNRALVALKFICLGIGLALLFPHVDVEHLTGEAHRIPYLWATAPTIVTAFGYHTIIPTLVNYGQQDVRKVRSVIIVGSTLPLCVYALWLAAVLGILPLHGLLSFESLAESGGSVGQMTHTVQSITDTPSVRVFVTGFTTAAVTTSFLGVTLGLFDFLADGFKRPNTLSGRAQTATLTFLLPLLFALFYPDGFLMALGYAAILASIVLVILPGLMALRLRRSPHLHSPYTVPGGNACLVFIIAVGAGLILAQVAETLGFLPKLL